MTLSRRNFLTQFATLSAGLALSRPAMARHPSTFGVIPNSHTDQTRVFQAMLDWSARRNQTIYLDAGTYRLSSIELPENTKIIGVKGQTILSATRPEALMRAQNASNISLSDIVIDGGNVSAFDAYNGLLELRNVAFVDMQNVEIRNSGKDTLYIERCGGTLQNCTLSGAKRHGIFGLDCRDFLLLNNRIDRCGDGGIVFYQSQRGHDGAQMIGNKITNIGAVSGGTGQNGNGINVFRADNVMIKNNHMENCAFSAIRANATTNTQIISNLCLKSGETAIYAEFEYKDATVKDNYIDGGANGISVANLDVGGRGAIVTGNTVKNITRNAPYEEEEHYFGHGIHVEADALVAGNLVENIASNGISVGWGPYLDNVTVQNNIIKNAGIGIAVSSAEGAGIAKLIDNQISANDGAIRTHRWLDVSPTDLALSPKKSPSNVILSGNRVI